MEVCSYNEGQEKMLRVHTNMSKYSFYDVDQP